MTLLKLTLITLLSTTMYAEKIGQEGHDHLQAVQIDMHGGKEAKEPSSMLTKKAEIFYGNVLEIKSAMGYKYLKMDENGTQLWIAISNAFVELGDRVGYDKRTKMTNFKSKSLNQEFKEIYFSSDVYLPRKTSAPQSMKAMLGLSSKKTSSEPKKQMTVKPFLKKDSYTIEEIHMWRTELKDKMITLEATATKVSHAIMKRDWIHLSDGSGSEMMLNNDLVFTASASTVKPGDKVIAKGKVIVDKDFGYGYFYKVIIEDASFEVK